MIVYHNIKSTLEIEFKNASSVWIASAMITYKGWEFIQHSISQHTTQHYLIGIDLSTEPKVFESIISDSQINARIYETQYTFHPKVYLIKNNEGIYTAFIGSSNTTIWGLDVHRQQKVDIIY